MSDVIWSPGPDAIAAANITRFAAACGMAGESYGTLHRWSISDREGFWRALWDFSGVIGARGGRVYDPPADGGMVGGHWFPEARLNFAENLLAGPPDALAVVDADETGIVRRVSRRQLRAEVARVASGLRAMGIGPGDRVGCVLPNRLEALVTLLASAALGAVWSSCSPDFGAAAIIDRLGQIDPKMLVVAPHYVYAGRRHDISARLREIAVALPSLRQLVLTGPEEALAGCPIPTCSWEDFGDPSEMTPEFASLGFSHPLYVLFTSGTTGKPKAIVHGAGGVLLQHLKEHRLHCDLKSGDVLGWYSNTAWMMYHWSVSALASGAAVVLNDGAAIPKGNDGSLDAGLLWRVAGAAGVTHFGASPKYLHTIAEAGYRPRDRHDLTGLRSVLSAGAPLAPGQFDWLYDAVKPDIMVASISGGTEIIGCFLIGNPTLPVRRGQLTCKALGLAVDVLDPRGASVIGEKGDLVCTQPFPSMPLTFWGADGDQRYRETYFAARPGIWTHGDLAELTIHGSAIVHGRTDTTLKPGGVRIGTAEIYATVERFAEIEDCLVFGAPVAGDEEIVLCLKPAGGATVGDGLAAAIRKAIREAASPRHVPHRIHVVAAIPYTLNGKRVEGAARAVMTGQIVKNLDSLSNPEALEQFRSLTRETAL